MYFTSKKDIRYGLLFWLPMIFILALPIFNSTLTDSNKLLVYGLNGIIVAFLLWIWFGTRYQIKDAYIKVTSGPFRTTIQISDIQKLSPSRGGFGSVSGPALSVERLEIIHGKHNNTLNISPKNKQDFVKKIVKYNPDVEVDEKFLI